MEALTLTLTLTLIEFKVHGGIIAYNRIVGNNYLQCGAYESAGLKTHGFSGVIEGNLVYNNSANAGVWFDTLWHDVRFTRNVVLNNGHFIGPGMNTWTTVGVQFEIGLGPAIVDNNILAGSDPGSGLIGIDANNMTLFGNLLVGNGGGCKLPHPAYHAAAPLPGMPNCGQLNIGLCTPRAYGFPSYGCSEALTTENTTMKNWLVGGNMFLSHGGIPWADVATFDWAPSTWKVWHPVCNISIEGNVYTGQGTHRLANFTSRNVEASAAVTAVVRVEGDGVPVLHMSVDASVFAVSPPQLQGSEIDFTGKPREGPLVAGPLQGLRSGESAMPLWPIPRR